MWPLDICRRGVVALVASVGDGLVDDLEPKAGLEASDEAMPAIQLQNGYLCEEGVRR